MKSGLLAGAALAGVIVLIAPAGRGLADSPPSQEAQCLALTLYWEAGTEGRPGMEAVASVILNRQKHPEFPDTICAVVQEGGETPPCEFNWWCDGRSDRPRFEDQWRLAQRVARDLLDGRTADPTRAALYFHAEGASTPWHATRPRTAQIGNHVFYR